MKIATRNKKKVAILVVIVAVICFLTFVIFGSTYTLQIDPQNASVNYDNIAVELDSSEDAEDDSPIVEILEYGAADNLIYVKLKSKRLGHGFITVTAGDYEAMRKIYVHNFGVITRGNFFGDATGDFILPIGLGVVLVYIFYLSLKSYRKMVKVNLYRYKNITRLGLIIFLGFAIVVNAITVFSYYGIWQTISDVISVFGAFSVVLFPVIFLLSIFVMITSVILARKEGFNWRNFLGFLIGLVLCAASITPELSYRLLQSTSFVDIHNEQGIATYVYQFIESAVYLCLSYAECILISTIIITVKAARLIPSFDKDYLLILGCYVKPDGDPGGLLKSRLDRAIEFKKMQKEKTGKKLILVPSGGKGNDESISEAECMKRYLMKQGINKRDILMEDRSTNTEENIRFSNDLIKLRNKKAKIAFATTNYHVFRTGVLAAEQGLCFEGMGAKTHIYFWINAFVREFIAEMVLERKRHLLAVAILLVLSLFFIAVLYYVAIN